MAKFNLNASGNSQLLAASYYGVDNPQANSTFQGNDALSMTLDANGAPWLTGQAFTTNLPVTAGAIQAAPTAMSSSCAAGPAPLNGFTFVAKLSADLSSLPYASYLSGKTEPAGGTACSEFGRSIALDATGNVYITGGTASANFPTTVGAPQPTLPTGSGFGSFSSFVTKLNADGSAILWSTYFGGNVGSTFPGANIALDVNANTIWITTFTGGGSNYPITADALQKVHGGGAGDAGIAQFDAASGALKYSTYLGGGADDAGLAIAVDSGGSVFLAGTTNSTNFPTTANAFQPTLTENAFDGTDWFFSVLGSGTIGSVRPARGGNNGGATLTVRGAGFQSDAVGSLLSSTGTVVASVTAVNVAVDGSSADFVFTLDGVAPGSYDLRITNPDTSVFTKAAAFTVEAGGTPALSVQVIGRPKIRTGVASTFQIVVSNTGSQDAYMVPLWVTVPNTISVSVDGLNVSAGSNWFADTGVNRFPTFIPFVKAGGSETLSMAITAPIDIANISISAALQAPWFRTVAEVSAFATSPTSDIGCIPNASNPYFINCAGLYFAYLNANKVPFTASSVRAPTFTGLIKTLNTRARPLDGTGCPSSPPAEDKGFTGGVTAGSKDRKSKPPGHTPNPWNGSGNNDAWKIWQAGYRPAGYRPAGYRPACQAFPVQHWRHSMSAP